MSDCCSVAVFNWAIWSARYPTLATPGGPVTEAQAAGYFEEAGLYLSNCASSPVWPIGKRAVILGMITAHLAALVIRSANASDPAGAIVGRIASATQGSVTTALELDVPGSAAWWAQTAFGLNAWQALAPYRVAAYLPAPQIPLQAQSFPGRFGGFVGGGFVGGFPLGGGRGWPR